MSDTNFTKGEWSIIDSTGKSLSVWASESECITTINYNFWDEKYQSELKANAHLIAATPDMYAMLGELSEMVDKLNEGFNADHKAIELSIRAESLLKKARGE